MTRSPLAATKIYQAYCFAIDPTPEQANLLRSHIGASRFCYNTLLRLVQANWDENRTRKDAGEEVSKDDYLKVGQLDLQKLWYGKRDELAPWWSENGSSSYNYAHVNLAKAFTNWRKGRAKFPTAKKKKSSNSVTFMNGAIHLVDSHHVRISRVGAVKTFESTRKLYRYLERGTGRVLSATVTERSDTWTISFSVEVERHISETRAPERVIGIDVGLSGLYTGATPEGEQVLSVENPRNYQRVERCLARAQRVASRRQGPRKGVAPSNRWKKANARVQKIHANVANRRRNLIHETTTHLTKNYDLIVVEDLNVKGMLKNHALAKHISDANWAEFTRQLEYKSKWYGSQLIRADRYFASSKTCSSCGVVKATLSLGERVFCCEACGLTTNRDHNAAINLARWATSISAGTNSVAGRRGEVRPEQQNLVATAHSDEASTEKLALVSA